ncbi:MAG: DUF2384 domain-containing protein [Candidatus Obscuribacterales bacterium]|nr:DUF2384 domain-containing protein [Steroidobacteraceae bacterium]
MAASPADVAKVLGGRKALGRTVSVTDDWIDMIAKGLPSSAIDTLKAQVGLDDQTMAAALGLSTRTLARARSGAQRLDSVVSDRLYRLARLVAMARWVLENDERAMHWLTQPQFGLGQRRPVDFVKSDPGAREVENLLMRIEHSVYS